MRYFFIFFISALMLFFAACFTTAVPEAVQPYPIDLAQFIQAPKQESLITSYQQWIILAAYVITTLAAAVYTRHSDQKTKKKVKQQAIKDLPIAIKILKAILRKK